MATTLQPLKNNILFLVLTTLALLVAQGILRGILLLHNGDMATGIPASTLIESFVIGLRFDLIIASYLILPLALMLFFPVGLGNRYWARMWLGVGTFIVLFLGILELDFYKEFHTRLNSLVFQYMKEDPETVTKMVWAGFPVVRYLLLVGAMWLGLNWTIKKLDALCQSTAPQPKAPQRTHQALTVFAVRSLSSFVVLVLFIAGARGSVQSGPPLRWGDAVHSEYTFANHLALNGTFTLIKAASAMQHSDQSLVWRSKLDPEVALALTRSLVVTDRDSLAKDTDKPLLRTTTPAPLYPQGKVENIVFIIMESFAGDYVGVLGDPNNVTPEFDHLSERGLLFRRFFSNGTHTHQGMFASVACFPNLPGHEYLMQQPEGSQLFSGLPSLFPFKNDVYVYNGDFRWDNQEGFFRSQGMTRFIGRDDIEEPKFMDDVWGVSDEDLFNQSVKELDLLAKSGKPFYAVIQTLSNHTPFSLPDPLPVKKVEGLGQVSEHLTAMRYSDWALGKFFRDIEHSPIMDNTLFIVVGDHGFGSKKIHSAVDLGRFRVPMLIIAPDIQHYFGHYNDRVASQVDLVPTAMALLGQPFQHQCWGRDLLGLKKDDPGLAVIKPSGSDQTNAIIIGDDIVTLSPETPAELGRLSFEPALAWQKRNDPAQEAQLAEQLKGYVQTALNALYSGNVSGGGQTYSAAPSAASDSSEI